MRGAEKLWRWILVAALLSLGPLVWLQWRWIGDVSAADRERLRGWMRQGAERLSRDYEEQLFQQMREIMITGAVSEGSWFSSVEFQAEPRPPGVWEISVPRGPRGPFSEWVIARLNERKMTEEVWPALVGRQWGHEDAISVEVRVMERRAGGEVLFATKGWKAGVAADAETGLRGMGGPRGGPRPPREGRGGPFRPPPDGEDSGVVIQVQGSDGGLTSVVEKTRLKNLALSGVILLVLVASMGALAWSTRRAQRLAELKMEFVAGVSHELRTPLTVIRSAGENLADGVVKRPEAVAKYGAMVRDEGMRLSGMVEQILGYAGVESGRWRPAMERFDLAELAGSSGVFVKGDRLALEQCVRNLVDNADRHGWGVESLRVEGEGNLARVVVEDSGDGLEQDEMERLFQPFYRGQRSREKQIKGFGLGLALVRRVAEAHGGRVWAENRKEGGARFVIELPLDTNDVETDSADRG
jgi:hypothetical protein